MATESTSNPSTQFSPLTNVFAATIDSESPTPTLTSLLSTTSYPIPEDLIAQWQEADEETLLLYDGFGGLEIQSTAFEPPAHENPVPAADASTSPTRPVSPFQTSVPTEVPLLARKKRGRPRKGDLGRGNEDSVERRRLQVRSAQRAYRSWREQIQVRNEARIARLEAALHEMNAAVVSFSKRVSCNSAFGSNVDLQFHLHHTVETCRSLVEDVVGQSVPQESGISVMARPSVERPSMRSIEPEYEDPTSPVSAWRSSSSSKTGHSTISELRGFPMPLCPGSPLLFDTTASMAVETSQFLSQLRLACVYYAYFTLRNPIFTLDNLRMKYRFLLSLLSRERLTRYFEEILHVRFQPGFLSHWWKEIPFFRVGGAGTHYLRPPSKIGPPRRSETHGGPVRDDPLSAFSAEVQDQMGGEWFDLRDLEGFLHEKGVHLHTQPPKGGGQSRSGQAVISAPTLIKTLVRSCVCLGRSPGWRRIDVERALYLAWRA